MNSPTFRIIPLRSDATGAARKALVAGAPDHALVIADVPETYPCRHCLSWAQPGEGVILFPFASIKAGQPWTDVGPIFVHADGCQSYVETTTFPVSFRQGRVLRVYDARQNMIDAVVVNGAEPEAVVAKLLEIRETDFIHVHSVSRGCYTFRIERA